MFLNTSFLFVSCFSFESSQAGKALDFDSKIGGSNPSSQTIYRIVGELVTPPALGAGELAGSNPADPTN